MPLIVNLNLKELIHANEDSTELGSHLQMTKPPRYHIVPYKSQNLLK